MMLGKTNRDIWAANQAMHLSRQRVYGTPSEHPVSLHLEARRNDGHLYHGMHAFVGKAAMKCKMTKTGYSHAMAPSA